MRKRKRNPFNCFNISNRKFSSTGFISVDSQTSSRRDPLQLFVSRTFNVGVQRRRYILRSNDIRSLSRKSSTRKFAIVDRRTFLWTTTKTTHQRNIFSWKLRWIYSAFDSSQIKTKTFFRLSARNPSRLFFRTTNDRFFRIFIDRTKIDWSIDISNRFELEE